MSAARRQALIDISKEIENNPHIYKPSDKYGVWSVLSSTIYTKKQRRLNKELGIHKVNYFK